MKRSLWIFFAAISVAAIGAWALKEDDPWGDPVFLPLPYHESEVLIGHETSPAVLYWLDNERVLFQGHDAPKPQTRAEVENVERALYVWTPGGPLDVIRDRRWLESGLGYRYYCGHGDTILYGLGLNTNAEGFSIESYMEGLPGSFEEKVRRASYKDTHGAGATQYRSSDCSVTANANQAGRDWVPLPQGDGFIDFGSMKARDKSKTRIVLHKTADSEGIELPVDPTEVESICEEYVAHENALLFWNCFQSSNVGTLSVWERDNCRPYWLIWPDGRTKRKCIPFGPWVGIGGKYIAPTKRGLFLATLVDGTAGGYLISDEAAVLVKKGIVQKPSVSPDGCRVAFDFAETWRAAAYRQPGRGQRAGVLDLCTGNRE